MQNPRRQTDLGTGQVSRIAAAIHIFMMLLDAIQPIHIGDAGARQKIRGIGRMTAQLRPVRTGKQTLVDAFMQSNIGHVHGHCGGGQAFDLSFGKLQVVGQHDADEQRMQAVVQPGRGDWCNAGIAETGVRVNPEQGHECSRQQPQLFFRQTGFRAGQQFCRMRGNIMQALQWLERVGARRGLLKQRSSGKPLELGCIRQQHASASQKHAGFAIQVAGQGLADQRRIELNGAQQDKFDTRNEDRPEYHAMHATVGVPDMTVHALNDQEVRLLREEIELLMIERQKLLQVTGSAAVLVANLDSDNLPDDQDTIDAAEVLAESLNALSEETLKDALDSVRAEFDPEKQADSPRAN